MDTTEKLAIVVLTIVIGLVIIAIGYHIEFGHAHKERKSMTIETEILDLLSDLQIQLNYLSTQIETKLGPLNTNGDGHSIIVTQEDRINDTVSTLEQRMQVIESKLNMQRENHGPISD
tara:strand:+ start:262 stop:615 length:354 start_codon:yes stop_codon:yes gene_type:complete